MNFSFWFSSAPSQTRSTRSSSSTEAYLQDDETVSVITPSHDRTIRRILQHPEMPESALFGWRGEEVTVRAVAFDLLVQFANLFIWVSIHRSRSRWRGETHKVARVVGCIGASSLAAVHGSGESRGTRMVALPGHKRVLLIKTSGFSGSSQRRRGRCGPAAVECESEGRCVAGLSMT